MSELSIKYTAVTTATDGRDGPVVSDDGALNIVVTPPPGVSNKVARMRSSEPSEEGGTGAINGSNPEQLFAAGYCASFHGAVGAIAKQANLDVTDSRVTAKVSIGKDENLDLCLQIELRVSIPGLDEATARKVAEYAHQIDPYSRAMRGNTPVQLTIE